MASLKFDYQELDIESMLGGIMNEDVAEDILNAAVPTLQKSIEKYASKHINTGQMLASIKPTPVKKNISGYYLTVRPTGKDDKGVRNMEKMAYLEYGAVHHGQPATPVLAPAVNECEGKVLEKMQEEFNRRMKG